SDLGSITGDTYHATGMGSDVFKGSLQNGQFSETAQDDAHIIGSGKESNLYFNQTFPITINANAAATASVDTFTIISKYPASTSQLHSEQPPRPGGCSDCG